MELGAKHVIYIGVFVIAIALITYPTATLVISAFTPRIRPSDQSVALTFTLDKFFLLFKSETLKIVGATLTYAVLRTALAALMGLGLAWLTVRTNVCGRKLIDLLVYMPIFIPATLTYMGWIYLLAPKSGLLNIIFRILFGTETGFFDIFSMPGLILVGAILSFSFDYSILKPALQSMNTEYEEACRVTGSGEFSVLVKVVLPLLKPSLLIVLVLGLTQGFAVLGPFIYFGLPRGIESLSSAIFKEAKLTIPSNYSYATILSVLLLAISGTLILIYRRVLAMKQKYVTVTGKGGRFTVTNLNKSRYIIGIIAILFLITITVLPVFAVGIESLLPYAMSYRWEMLQMLTPNNYFKVFTNREFFPAIFNTFTLATTVAVACTLLAVIINYFATRSKMALRGTLQNIALFPLAMPGVVVGIALLWSYVATPLYGTAWMLLIALLITFLPSGIALTSSVMFQIDESLEESSTVSGASWLDTFRKIILPLALPASVSSVSFLMLKAAKEYASLLILSAPGAQVVSVLTYMLWLRGETKVAAALGVVELMMVFAVFLCMRLIERRVIMKRTKSAQ